MMNGETILTGAAPKCADCGTILVPQVCRSAAGYYVGTWCLCGPYSRESGYYPTREAAQADLDADTYGR